MNNPTKEYCIKELQVSTEEAERLCKKVSKYTDIHNEFLNWLSKRNYDTIDSPINIGGYSAKDIHEIAPNLTGIGVYNFLVTLRDNPSLAKEIIDFGFITQ